MTHLRAVSFSLAGIFCAKGIVLYLFTPGTVSTGVLKSHIYFLCDANVNFQRGPVYNSNFTFTVEIAVIRTGLERGMCLQHTSLFYSKYYKTQWFSYTDFKQ